MDSPGMELEDTGLGDFIRVCVERAGGVLDAVAPGRADLLVPTAFEPALDGRSFVSLALAGDAGGEDLVPATLGSPFVDALIEFATRRGIVGVGHLPEGRLRKKGLREEAERTLRFSNCRTRYQDDAAEVRLAAIAQFDFKVTFVSEERRERIYVVPVDLCSGQPHPDLAARLPGLAITPDAGTVAPEAPTVPVETAYQTAQWMLRQLVMDEASRQQVRAGRRFAVEAARIGEYYERAIESLERRRERERLHSPEAMTAARAAPEPHEGAAIPSRADGLAHKIEAARAERERKLRELGETYKVRARALLASARWLWQPKVFFQVMLDRGSVTRSLTLVYDGLLERLELPLCETCRTPTARLRASSTARLQCPTCSTDTVAPAQA